MAHYVKLKNQNPYINAVSIAKVSQFQGVQAE